MPTLCKLYGALLLTFILALKPFILSAQEALLELPGLSGVAADESKLEIMSPNEIDSLYRKKQDALPPLKREAPLELQKIEEASPEPVEKDSFTQLLEELENEPQNDSPDQFDIDRLWVRKSAMLLPNEVRTFNAAIRRYLASLNKPAVTIVEKKPEPKKAPGVTATYYPFIALSSILYISPENWSVWINGAKYTPKQTEKLSGLKVTQVTKEKVTIDWLRSTKTAQSSSPQSEPESDSLYENGTLPSHITSLENGRYRIILSSNQAFIPDSAELHEGRAATKRIIAIHKKQLSMKRQAEARSRDPNNNGFDFNDPVAMQEAQEKEDIAKLLELYKNNQGQNE